MNNAATQSEHVVMLICRAKVGIVRALMVSAQVRHAVPEQKQSECKAWLGLEVMYNFSCVNSYAFPPTLTCPLLARDPWIGLASF